MSIASSSTTTTLTPTSSLQTELISLQADLAALLAQAGQTTEGGSSTFTFGRNLSIGMTGSDVQVLQQLLIDQASGPAAVKLKAHGTTENFGILTFNALKEFQAKQGISPASGFFGPITRGVVNRMER